MGADADGRNGRSSHLAIELVRSNDVATLFQPLIQQLIRKLILVGLIRLGV